MAQSSAFGRRCARAFVSGFFVAVPVTVTVLDRLAYIARVEGASMQPSLNPEGQTTSDVVLLSRWSVRDYQVQRGDIVSLLSPKNPQQKIIKRVIGLEGDLVKSRWALSMAVPPTSSGHRTAGRESRLPSQGAAHYCCTGTDCHPATRMIKGGGTWQLHATCAVGKRPILPAFSQCVSLAVTH
uniref:Mitochondrial inner membrane protease subunit n=1 Tax=Paramormyrops kingsleyae TaxID=1676925 RepID=A0A3B3SGL1_9TELE